MTHAFLSYVSEDADLASHIADLLRGNGIEVWLDRDSLSPGRRWRDEMTDAIRAGKFYVPLFSRHWIARERAVANEELVIAIEELRLRPRDRAWFIPLRLDEVDIPRYSIGGGEYLTDIQYVDFPTLGWPKSIDTLLRACGVAEPALYLGDPLAPGLPPAVEILGGGQLVYETSVPPNPAAEGMIVTITGGWCARTKGGNLLAYLQTRAPSRQMQEIHELIGLRGFYAISTDKTISPDSGKPTKFTFAQDYVIPSGTTLPSFGGTPPITLQIDVPVKTVFIAHGYVERRQFKGGFSAALELDFAGQRFPATQEGVFEMEFAPTSKQISDPLLDLA